MVTVNFKPRIITLYKINPFKYTHLSAHVLIFDHEEIGNLLFILLFKIFNPGIACFATKTVSYLLYTSVYRASGWCQLDVNITKITIWMEHLPQPIAFSQS